MIIIITRESLGFLWHILAYRHHQSEAESFALKTRKHLRLSRFWRTLIISTWSKLACRPNHCVHHRPCVASTCKHPPLRFNLTCSHQCPHQQHQLFKDHEEAFLIRLKIELLGQLNYRQLDLRWPFIHSLQLLHQQQWGQRDPLLHLSHNALCPGHAFYTLHKSGHAKFPSNLPSPLVDVDPSICSPAPSVCPQKPHTHHRQLGMHITSDELHTSLCMTLSKQASIPLA